MRGLSKTKKIVKDKYEARRLLAEEEIRESERKYRELYETIQDGIFATNLEGNVIEFNRAFSDMIGHPAARIRNKNIFDIIPKEWHKMADKIIDQVMARGYSDEYEIEFTKKDGTVSYISVKAWLKKDRDGKPAGVWTIVRDITERKRAEKRYQDLVEKEKDIIYTLDCKGNITFTNPAVETVLGYRPEKLTCKHFMVLISKELQEKTSADFHNLLKTGEITAETVLLDREGQPHFVEYSSTVIKEGDKVVGTRGIIRDITERKRAEEELRESEQRYRRLLEYSGSAMVVIEKDRKISFANKEFEKISGYSKEDTIGRDFLDLIHKKHKERMARYHEERRRTKGKAPITYEFEAFDKKGGGKIIEVTVAMVPGTDRSTAALRDITEKKKLEKKIKQMTKELGKLRARIS